LLQKRDSSQEYNFKKDYFSAPTACVIAFSYAKNVQRIEREELRRRLEQDTSDSGRPSFVHRSNPQFSPEAISSMYERIALLAVDAVDKMASRKHVFAPACVQLFCGMYALADVIDYRRKNPAVKQSGNSYSERRRSFRPGGASAETTFVSDEVLKKTLRKGLQGLTTHAERYSFVSPLLWAIQMRFLSIDGDKKVILAVVDEFVEGNQNLLCQLTFPNAYLHYQRTILCRDIGCSTEIMHEQYSDVIAKNCFAELGGCPEDSSVFETLTLSATAELSSRRKGRDGRLAMNEEVDSNYSVLSDGDSEV